MVVRDSKPLHRSRPTLRFHGTGRNPSWNQQLLAAVEGIHEERRRHLNLTKLARITVTFDLDEAWGSLVRPKGSGPYRRKATSGQGRTTSAGCAFMRWRRKHFLGQVILDAHFLGELVDETLPVGCAANIVAHELAHVALFHWLDKPAWEYVFPTQHPDWRHEVLRYMTLDMWDEYAACRLSARVGDPKPVLINFMNCLRAHLLGGLPRLRRSTRKHWHRLDAAAPFVRAIDQIKTPLVSAAYLMGHLDGLGIVETVSTLSTPARTSPLAPCWDPLHQALRQVWARENPRFGLDVLDALTPPLMEAIQICGGGAMLYGIHLPQGTNTTSSVLP